MKCYCWSTGLIEFGEFTPECAIEIASGPEQKLMDIVSVCARHSRFDGRLIVPGVPEAETGRKALQALDNFKGMIEQRWDLEIYNPETEETT